MRSRYSAYVLRNLDYLRASWHPDFRPGQLSLDPKTRWLGLQVITFEPAGDRATVEFEARLLSGDRLDAIHEKSRFVHTRGQWFYTDGDLLPPTFSPRKIGRNETCPCGSGRKFKRCCADA